MLGCLQITGILSQFINDNYRLVEDAEELSKKSSSAKPEATVLREAEEGVAYFGAGPFQDV